MIRNIVFDMAWVLFEYRPMEFVNKYCPNPDDAELVNRELYCAPEWNETDRGTMTDEEYLSIVLKRIPTRLHGAAKYLYDHWHEMPKPFECMEELIRVLKGNGYGIYLLTNMSSRFYRFYQRIPAIQYFDGMIVSADVHMLKPEPGIYLKLFDKFCLKPEECFFVDDRKDNIEAGEALGMKGFCYQQSMEELKKALEAEGIRI